MCKQAGKPATSMTPFREIRIKRLGRSSLSFGSEDTVLPIPARKSNPREMVKHLSIHFPEGTIINLRFRLERSRNISTSYCEEIYRLEDLGIGQDLAGVGVETIRETETEIDFFWQPPLTKTH